jgi:hypothetical protein
MSNPVTLGQVEQLAIQLPLAEQLKLVARICEHLSIVTLENETQQLQQQRLQLAEALLAECDDIADDSQGEFDAVEDIRRLRENRLNQICQSDA